MTGTHDTPDTTRSPDGLGRVVPRAPESSRATDLCGEGATGTVVPTHRHTRHAVRPGTDAGGCRTGRRQGTGGSTSSTAVARPEAGCAGAHPALARVSARRDRVERVHPLARPRVGPCRSRRHRPQPRAPPGEGRP